MLIAHKIALDPNDKQAAYFTKAAGVARFAYNWALAEWKRQYEASYGQPESAETIAGGIAPATQCHQAGAVPLDAGGHRERSADGVGSHTGVS